MAASSKPKSVLFICLGNICRSTMAEAIFLHLLTERNQRDEWLVDSAAIEGWNVGSSPDNRALNILRENGIADYKHKARQIVPEDFRKFDIIFGMDDDNMANLEHAKPKGATASLKLLGEYDPEKDTIIEDPFFTSDVKAFEKVYAQCYRDLKAFLDSPK